jgi:hypothetical protein
MHRLVRLALCLGLAVALRPAFAQDLTVLGGSVRDMDGHHTSYSYELEYMQALGKHTAISLAYLNEGHLPDDHRDGYPLQFWGRTDVLDERVTLSAGLGPYWYLDTHRGTAGGASADDHGLGSILSLDAAWHTGQRWNLHLRGNWVNAPGSFDTATVGVGASYALSSEWCAAPRLQAPVCPGWTTGEELTLFAGPDVVNSFEAARWSVAECLEYRRGVARNADWTVGLFHEHNERLARQLSVASQLWVSRPVSGEEWTVGLGLGPYVVVTEDSGTGSGETDPPRVCGVISATAARRLSAHSHLRFSWNRVFTSDSRDTDMLMLGFGWDLAPPRP